MNEKSSGELSHFEALSAVIPKKTPIAILVGTALVPIVLWVINVLAPTEAVDELKNAEEEASKPAETAPVQTGDDLDI